MISINRNIHSLYRSDDEKHDGISLKNIFQNYSRRPYGTLEKDNRQLQRDIVDLQPALTKTEHNNT